MCAESQDSFFEHLLYFAGKRECVVMLEAYFDESERKTGVFCVAGYVFAPSQAKKFSKEWASLFNGYAGGCHMVDLAQRTGAFKGILPAEQQRLIVEAVKIINKRVSHGVAVSCNIDEVNHLSPKWIRGFGHAYPVLCHLAMTEVGMFLRRTNNANRVIYIFEAGHPSEAEARDFVHNALRSPVAKESYRHAGDAFLPKSDAVPLQAADMFAWEWAKFRDETLEQNIRPIRKSLVALFEPHIKRYSGHHISGESLAKWMGEVHRLGLEQLQEEKAKRKAASV